MNRALCLTDVVDSTKLAAALGEAANAALWDAHDRAARGLLARFGGTELERTDGIMALFDDVDAAVGFALAYHEALSGLSPRLVARAGVHFGAVVERYNPVEHVVRGAKALEVDGLALAITARVQSVAQGGQTLLSSSARGALRSAVRVVSHGHWRLKGLDEPVELFEAGADDAPFAPPADGEKAWRVVREGDLWLPARSVPHDLPRERDAFVGREGDLRALAGLVEGAALVSVLGIGGTGKTRLVTRYAWRWLGEYPGGAWFCDVADARDVDGIVAAVARVFDVPFGPEATERIGRAIAGRGRCLVILDNFEQVARHAGETLGRWLDRAHQARFVVTTREVLGLPGESALALAPLDTTDAEALFVARAKQAGAVVRDEDRAAVTELVRLLDQLPLAIELAAARARLMPPKTLLERMSQRFRLLTASGGRHTRQMTLRAALDWSWDLLSADEQAALAQLSVFEGFTLAAAEAVLDLREAWPADAVQGLLDKSLLRVLPGGRLTMLVSVQEYAAERLGEGRAAAEARHGAYYATYGAAELDWPDTPEGFAARWVAAPEVGNLLAAGRRAVARGDAEVALGALAAAFHPLTTRNLSVALPVADGLYALRDALGPIDRARATRYVAMIRRHCRVPGALAVYDDGLAQTRALGLLRDEANLWNGRGAIVFGAGRLQDARQAFEAASALNRRAGFVWGEAQSSAHLGVLEQVSGRPEVALGLLTAAVALARRAGDPVLELNVSANLGAIWAEQGRLPEAEALLERMVGLAVDNPAAQCMALVNLAVVLVHAGRAEDAVASAGRAVAACRATGDVDLQAVASRTLCAASARVGRFDQGRAAGRWALEHARARGDGAGVGASLAELAELELRAGAPGAARPLLDEALAALREAGDAAELQNAHCVEVAIALALGDRPAAERALAEASGLAATLGARPGSVAARRVAEAEAALGAPTSAA